MCFHGPVSARGIRPFLLLAALAGPGCYAPPPGIDDPDLVQLENVSLGRAWIYYRKGDLTADEARALASDVAGVREGVGKRTGVEPPRAEVVVYAPSGPPSTAEPFVHPTLARADREHVRFRYPLAEDDPLGRSQLLGTVGHEVAEATVLGAVEAIDPHVRWLHDGIAELVEHEVLVERDPATARRLLDRALDFVRDRRAAGVEWVDLTRWRQIAPTVVRSHRFVGRPNLSLDDVAGARARVAAARAGAPPERLAQLDELDGLLERVEARRRLPWRPGEATTDDPDALDYVFYVAAFAVWLDLERAAPGVVARTVAGLRARREGGDLVLAEEEGLAIVREAAKGAELPPLVRVELEQVERRLRVESARLP